MRDTSPMSLVDEDAVGFPPARTPLADGPLRQQFVAAAETIRNRLADSLVAADERDALALADRLLSDWLSRGFPTHAPAERVALVMELLTRAGFQEAADDLGRRFPAVSGVGGIGKPPSRIIVRIPPPANEVGLTPWFAPPVRQLDLARQQLARYEAWLGRQSDMRPILPPRHSRLTGMTRFMNGRLAATPTDLKPESWRDAAYNWLMAWPTAPDEPPAPASCLFGLDDRTVAGQQLAFLDVAVIPDSRAVAAGSGSAARLATAVHVRFQQKHGAWPVLGGRVVVHMAVDDPRSSVSSSYLPIPPDRFAHCRLRSEADAVAIALRALTQHALNGEMTEAEALGLYLAVLDRWLADGQSDLTGGRWGAVASAAAQALAARVRASAAASLLADPLARLEDALADLRQAQIQDARHALHEIQAALADERIVRWDAGRVVRYLPGLADAAGRPDNCFVLPFVGEFYLAYRVEFLSLARDRGWRVYVNADAGDTTCDVLGWPESMLAHDIEVFRTSAAAAADAPQFVPTPGIDLSFMMPRWHDDAVAGAPPWTVAELEQNLRGLDPGLILDAANVAYHASEFYRYFSSLCPGQAFSALLENPQRPTPYFEVQVGAGANAGDPLSTGFLASAVAPTIVFQSADLLQVGLRTVHRPARDPEVAAHELAHALMWLINSEPFDLSAGVTPFARSLVEGYANYYARAYAVSWANDAADALWARGCYRGEAFGDRFDLSRNSLRDPAGNLLPFPNLYPPPGGLDPDATDPLLVRSLQKYSVGMVWARALWELREQYRTAGSDPLLVDRWALNAYYYMPGWLASFEIAAEGILDQLTPAQAQVWAERFGVRNILAGRGVQALALAGTEALVGTDVGVRRAPEAAIAWGMWERFGVGEGVTALAYDPASGKTFAATERGVYAWDAGLAAWTPHGTWQTKLAQETPLCLAADAGMVYVGASRGLYALAATAPGGDWTRWEGQQSLEYLARDVAVTQQPGVAGPTVIVYVATLREARKRTLAADRDPRNVQWVNAATAALQAAMGPTTAVALIGDTAYLGALQGGIWRQSTLANSSQWTQIAAPGDVGAAAVLALRVREVGGTIEALAGTTAGLFLGRAAGGWTWSEIAFNNDPAAHETITALLYLDDTTWLVGTANRGLWRVAAGAGGPRVWTQYADIGL